MKVQVEINYVDDGRVFLNYWNSLDGDDVICEVVGGQLIHYDADDAETKEEVTFAEFIKMVKDRQPI